MKITLQSLPRTQAAPKELLAALGMARIGSMEELHQPSGLVVWARSSGLGNPFVRLEASGQSTCGDGSLALSQASHYALSGCWGTPVGRAPRQRSLALRHVERGSVSV